MKKSFFNPSEFTGLLITCVLVLAFFMPALIKGEIPIPADSLNGLYHPYRDISLQGYNPEKFPVKNPLITDPVLQTYPWRYQVINSFKQKSLPLWNPFNFSGQPLLANLQSAPLQLGNLLFYFLNFKVAWGIQIILQSILASIFMYLLLRDLRLSRQAAIYGGVALPFSGFFIAWLTWGNIITVAMYLPLILLCINKLWRKITPIPSVVLTFAFFQAIVSGHAQTSLYVFLATILFTLYKTAIGKKLKPLLIIGVSLVSAIFISMPQILPTLEFINSSARSIDQAYYPGRQDWFLPYQNLVQLVAPDFFGNPATYNYWGIWNYAEFVSFIGIIPLSLVLFAIIKKKPETYFFIVLLIISLALSLENPLSKIPYLYKFPFLSSLQPSRIIFLLDFSLVSLSAFGLDYFTREKSKKLILYLLPVPLIVFTLFAMTRFGKGVFPARADIDTLYVATRNLFVPLAFSAGLIFIGAMTLWSKISKKFLVIAIFALTLIDLFRFGQKFTPFSKLSSIFPQTKTTDYLSSQAAPFRILSTDRRIASGNSFSAYNIEAINGYDPLYLNSWANVVQAWESGKVQKPGSFNRILTPENYKSIFANILNVKYVLSFDELADPNLEKVFQEGKTKVYLNKKALPRAFFVNQVLKVDSKDQELSTILSDKFDPQKTAVSSYYSFNQNEFKATVNFTSYKIQSFRMKAETDSEAPLVVSNVDYPGWEAYIDGNKTQIQKVNYMFQSILVPKGIHSILFKFHPSSFYNGLYLAVVGLFIALIQTIFIWRKKYLL